MPVIFTPEAFVPAFVMVRSEPPRFEMVTDCEAVLPTGTAPKEIDSGATEIEAAEPGALEPAFDALVRPMHPEVQRRVTNKKQKVAVEYFLFFSEMKEITEAIFRRRGKNAAGILIA
jgi:hypothetical protein